jgi:hypothetical protein
VARRRVGKYPKGLRKIAVERLKGYDNIVALSEELGVHRRSRYQWRDRFEAIDDGQVPPENSQERELRLQVAQLKRLVADKTLEADFFKGALQKLEARRQGNKPATTTKSGN